MIGSLNSEVGGRNSEPQNIEQEISNDEGWNRCALSFFKNNNDRIPYFDIRHSLFDIRYSFFQSVFYRFQPNDLSFILSPFAFHLSPFTFSPFFLTPDTYHVSSLAPDVH
jgi:hypothetical protein